MPGDPLTNHSAPQGLTEGRWRRIESLFHAARTLPEDARAEFLDREAGADPDLRRQIEEMLGHTASAAELLARTVSAVAREAAGREAWIGCRMGPYRLVREVGRGGMGVVFEACRDDDEYQKTVAVKIAPAWRASDMAVERLRHERQILAGLEHPNIARFLDGASQDGMPYFAMEFVEGSPITAFCREQDLELRARIELFRQVCAAVHYAHERMVVHRDLKPANILVTKDGIPKLLDFGIAKLVTPVKQDGTATRIAIWTPDYASPEQVRGQPVTARTDVYSLGLILFEMLTGGQAQVADNSSPAALERSICEVDIPCAGAKAPPALARQLAGDLETIIGKATQKDAARRYASAEELSDDLGRHLEGRPVRARKDTAAYRVSKFVRRNRVPVSAAAVAMLGLAVGAIGFTWQARQSGRPAAGASRTQARAVSSSNPEANKHYLTGVFWRIEPTIAHLRKAESEFRAAIDADPSYGPAQAALAEVYGRLYFTESVSAEQSLVPSRAAAAKALEHAPQLAASHEAAALVHLIDWDWAGAEREYLRAIELDPKHVRTRQAYAQLYLSPAGRYQQAIEHLQKAIELDPVNVNLVTELGVNYRLLGKLGLARETFQRSLELHPSALGTRTNIVILDQLAGNYSEAAQKMEAIYRDGSDDPWVMGQFGYTCAMAGRTADARRILGDLKAGSHSALHIAAVHAGLGEKDAALDWLERGVAMHAPSLFWLRSDFRFASLRSEPRLQRLLDRLPK